MLGIKGSPRAAFQSAASQSAIAFEERDVELSQDQSTFSALARGQFATKRAIDIAGASIALMALAPVLLTVAGYASTNSVR